MVIFWRRMIKPMLAEQGGKEDLTKKGYIYEPKLDGTRAICYFDGKKFKLINRRDRDITYRYPEFSEFVKLIKYPCILDGEIVVYYKGKPNFNQLQRREQVDDKVLINLRSKEIPATYVVFDIIKKGRENLTNLPLRERKKYLDDVVENGKHLKKIVFTKDGKKLWNIVRRKNMEGVMAKKFSDKYYVGRRVRSWLKIKFTKTLDAVIVGYTTGKRALSSILAAAYYKGKLKFIGKVGTGFSEKDMMELKEKLDKIRTNKKVLDLKIREKIYWVKPKIVFEAEFLKLTRNKIMRAPVFLRVRTDKKVKECVI